MNAKKGNIKKLLLTDVFFFVIFVILNAIFVKMIFQPYGSLDQYGEENTLFDILVCGWLIYSLLPPIFTFLKIRSFLKSFLALIRFQILILSLASLISVIVEIYAITFYSQIDISMWLFTLISLAICSVLLLLYRYMLKRSTSSIKRNILFLLIPLYILFIVLSFFVVAYVPAFGNPS